MNVGGWLGNDKVDICFSFQYCFETTCGLLVRDSSIVLRYEFIKR
jgi:hypothetical protein